MDMERESERERTFLSMPKEMATIWQRERQNEHQQKVFISENEKDNTRECYLSAIFFKREVRKWVSYILHKHRSQGFHGKISLNR